MEFTELARRLHQLAGLQIVCCESRIMAQAAEKEVFDDSTHLDINLFRKEKGGDPEVFRISQQRRFKPVELVDEVVNLDEAWRKGEYGGLLSIFLHLLAEFTSREKRAEANALQKEITAIRKVGLVVALIFPHSMF